MFNYLFARLPKHIEEQREQARRNASNGGAHGGH
jgi:hypothetical protein